MKSSPVTKFFSLTTSALFAMALVSSSSLLAQDTSQTSINPPGFTPGSIPGIIPGSTDPGTAISDDTDQSLDNNNTGSGITFTTPSPDTSIPVSNSNANTETLIHVGTQQPNAPTRYTIGTADNPVTVSEYAAFLSNQYPSGGPSAMPSQPVPMHEYVEMCNTAYDADLMDSTSSDYCIDFSYSINVGSYYFYNTYIYSYAIVNNVSSDGNTSASVPTANWIIDAVASQEVANNFENWRKLQSSAK